MSREALMPYYANMRAGGDLGELCLTKLVGQSIKDIYGYIDTEGDPVFLMTRVILEDGSDFFAEGEHDRPYLYSGSYEHGAKYVVDLKTLVEDYDDEGGD